MQPKLGKNEAIERENDLNPETENDHASRATSFATLFPAADKEREWEQPIGDLIGASMSFAGHQGSIVLKPE